MEVQTYFDFKLCFKEVLKETLKKYKSAEQFISENYLDEPKELEKASELFRFITDDKQIKRLLFDFENSEDQQVDFEAEHIEICFDEDTSTHNEGGSHYGGYQYNFGINTDEGTFTGLEVINHN
jgi:hypothetical protein